MKKIIIIVLALALIGAGVWYFALRPTEREGADTGEMGSAPPLDLTKLTEYQNETYAISFLYPSAYALTEAEVGTGNHRVTLTGRAAAGVPVGTGAITIDIYPRRGSEPLGEWLQKGNANFNLSSGTRTATVIAESEAQVFHWSEAGLEADTIAIVNGDYFYVGTVRYSAITDQVYKDFPIVIGTLSLGE